MSAELQESLDRAAQAAEVVLADLLGSTGLGKYVAYTSQYGSANTARWNAEDKWVIGYTTERIIGSRGGVNDGKFATITWKPVYANGKRSGEIVKWTPHYFRTFSTRKKAKARALVLYGQHSPKWLARRGGVV